MARSEGSGHDPEDRRGRGDDAGSGSPFGPLELPRDRTEMMPLYGDPSGQGQGQGPGQGPGQPGPLAPPPYAAPHAYGPPPGGGRVGPPPQAHQTPPPHPGMAPPPAGPPGAPARPQFAPPTGPPVAQGGPGGPGGPVGDDRTQMLPPVPPGPVHPPSDDAATQMFQQLPPQAHQAPPPSGAQWQGPPPQQQQPQQPQGSGAPGFPQGLFRDEPAGPPSGAFGAQQQQYVGGAPQQAQPYQQPPQQPPRHDDYDDYDDYDNGRRRGVMIGAGAAAVVLCVIAGMFAGGVFDSDDKAEPAAKSSSASASATGAPKPSAPVAPADPTPANSASAKPTATPQAKALDGLLNNAAGPRNKVVQAVAKINKCEDVPAAVQDLNEAAQHRDQKIAELSALKVDQIDGGDKIVGELRKAWAASAEADRKYAAWGAEVQGGKCKDKKAEITDNKKDGDKASGKATPAKQQAVKLWNPVAKENGLKNRSAGEL